MAKIDLNGDGGISVEEFVELNMRQDKEEKKLGKNKFNFNFQPFHLLT